MQVCHMQQIGPLPVSMNSLVVCTVEQWGPDFYPRVGQWGPDFYPWVERWGPALYPCSGVLASTHE